MVEPLQVNAGGRDVGAVFGVQPGLDAVVLEVLVRVAQQALLVPDDGLRLVGATAFDLGGGGRDAVLAKGGVDVAAAEEDAVDGVGGSEAHDGEVVTVLLLGGVGGERVEEDIQVGT